MSRMGLVFHEDYTKHETGFGHPERPARLVALREHLDRCGLLSDLIQIAPRPAPLEVVEKIHTSDYIQRIESRCAQGPGYLLDGETGVCEASYRIALLAVGGGLSAVDAVMDGAAGPVFCAVRPPGHHAERNRAMGFCLFNNIAIVARYIQDRYDLERILIVDWDVHHGNGTQNAFYDDPTVLYFSIHAYPHYPGTGSVRETGIGAGEGYTVNVPLPSLCGDEEYLSAFREVLLPKADAFLPDFVLISAGFDAHRDDPLAGMGVTEAGFEEMTRIVKGIAHRRSRGRLVSLLEGGYHLDALSRSVEEHLSALMSDP